MSQNTEYKNKFASEKYDRVGLMLKKGTKAVLQEVAKDKGESVNSYIKNAVKERYQTDTGQDIEL